MSARDTSVTGDVADQSGVTDTVYPAELEADVTIPSGRTLRLRPIRADDERKLRAFHRYLSADSIYRRYFSFHPELSDDEVRHLTHVDYQDRLALVIEDDDELVAVAFVVRDDYQHLGLGHRLFSGLAAAAWPRGIDTFTAETLCRNHDMLSVFHHSGFPMTSSISAGEVSTRLSIKPRSDALSSSAASPAHEVHPWS